MLIEQAIYGGQDRGGYRFLARSPGFSDEWLAEAERLCTGFGERPAGVSCPAALFARPFAQGQVAVVQVADQGLDDAGRPGALAFRLLILPRDLYGELGGDPFHIAEHLPPPWQARGELPALKWTAGPSPHRTVADLGKVLDVPSSATLLGGAEALLDGWQLVFERTEPDPQMVRSLWSLLPTSSRSELWPASFAFGNAHGFDVVVVPRAAGPEYTGYLREAQVGDYPEGRYELGLQTAVEAGDQRALDALLARRSPSQVLRLAAGLLAAFILLPVAVFLFAPGPAPVPNPPQVGAPAAGLDLPPADECPALSEAERRELARRLQALGRALHITLPKGTSREDLTEALARLDARLGTPDSRRDPDKLSELGPLQRQLRALLWKHGVPGYGDRGLNTVELVEKLEKRLLETGGLRGRPGD